MPKLSQRVLITLVIFGTLLLAAVIVGEASGSFAYLIFLPMGLTYFPPLRWLEFNLGLSLSYLIYLAAFAYVILARRWFGRVFAAFLLFLLVALSLHGCSQVGESF